MRVANILWPTPVWKDPDYENCASKLPLRTRHRATSLKSRSTTVVSLRAKLWHRSRNRGKISKLRSVAMHQSWLHFRKPQILPSPVWTREWHPDVRLRSSKDLLWWRDGDFLQRETRQWMSLVCLVIREYLWLTFDCSGFGTMWQTEQNDDWWRAR